MAASTCGVMKAIAICLPETWIDEPSLPLACLDFVSRRSRMIAFDRDVMSNRYRPFTGDANRP